MDKKGRHKNRRVSGMILGFLMIGLGWGETLPTAQASSYTYTPIFTTSLNGQQTATNLYGINNSGEISGMYSGYGIGFIDNNGTFTEVKNPNVGYGLNVRGINSGGAVVGYGIEISTSFFTSFIDNKGTFTIIGVPPGGNSTGDQAFGINKFNAVVGWFANQSTGQETGYEYANGIYTNILPPNTYFKTSVAYGINNSGEIVGNADGYGNGGFLYENGKYSPINLTIPGLLINGVTPRGISGNGDIVGYYDWINQKTLTPGTLMVVKTPFTSRNPDVPDVNVF